MGTEAVMRRVVGVSVALLFGPREILGAAYLVGEAMLAHRVAEHFDIAHRGLLGGTKSLQNEENKLDLGRWTRLGYIGESEYSAC